MVHVVWGRLLVYLVHKNAFVELEVIREWQHTELFEFVIGRHLSIYGDKFGGPSM